MNEKARRSRFLAASIGLSAAVATVMGCERVRRHRELPPVDGIRFFAVSYLTGKAADSVYVRVSVRNDAASEREIQGGVCGDELTVRMYRGASKTSPAWDSELWRRATEEPRPCALPSISYLLHPGATIDLGAITLPTHAILGDTLGSGSYRVAATPNNSAAQAGETYAGVIELRAR